MAMNPMISTTELSALLGSHDLVLLDARSDLVDPESARRAYETAHLPGAVYADFEAISCAPKTGRNGRHPLPDMDVFTASMRALGVNDDSVVVLYDAGACNFAARIWFMMRMIGFENVRVLDGGIAAWIGEQRPVTNEAASAKPGSVTRKASLERVFTVDEVLANLENPSFTLLDARSEDRFAGQNETMDPVGGHIPGALNRFFMRNMENGRMKAPETIRAEFAAVLGDVPASRIVNSCGSGVTACSNHLAMRLAGIPAQGVYMGSWSEWCSDPARPVATDTN